MKNLDIKQYAYEISAIETEMAELKKRKSTLERDVQEYYDDDIQEAYSIKSEPFGQVEFGFDDVNFKLTTPKRVSWDQEQLASIYEKIGEHEDPKQYIDVVYKVNETKWKSWPENIRAVFMPARTVKPGAPKVCLVVHEEEE